MKKMRLMTLIVLTALIAGCQLKPTNQNENEEITAKYFDQLKSEKDNAMLTMFFTQMPKGGDIHHHYSGALYVETYLDWAAKNQMTIDSQTLRLNTKGDKKAPCITIDSLRTNSTLYRAVLNAWSDMDFSNFFHQEDQPDQHFFNTFSYFGSISSVDYAAGLNELKFRAKKENIQYLETMLSSPSVKMPLVPSFRAGLMRAQREKNLPLLQSVLDSMSMAMRLDTAYNNGITRYVSSLVRYQSDLDDADFKIRFQAYTSRNSNPDEVFTKLYGCFDAVRRNNSSVLVGVNIVGPENGVVAMRDYWLHMQMFRYLKGRFPKTRTAMHAGELAMGMVEPEDLTYHINDAVQVAGANRIGHGVDLPYETNAMELLKTMARNQIAVEINLTSNEFILGVRNEDHPIRIYAKANVPLVISTDDAGVSRNNLTVEYVKLASRYNFNYKQLKAFVYNSIQYSFLSEPDKKELLKKLDQKFITFESKIAAQYSGNKKFTEKERKMIG